MTRLLPILVFAVGCAHDPHRHVYVPKTPEAGQCWRECKAIAATCLNRPHSGTDGFANAIHNADLAERCETERQDCLLSCPGAREEWLDDHGNPVPPKAGSATKEGL